MAANSFTTSLKLPGILICTPSGITKVIRSTLGFPAAITHHNEESP